MAMTLDNLSRGWRDAVHWGPLIECDISDLAEVCGALEKYKPDLVAHFAAFAYIGESVDNPAIYYENNTAGTLALLNSMRAQDAAIFCSLAPAPVTAPLNTPR